MTNARIDATARAIWRPRVHRRARSLLGVLGLFLTLTACRRAPAQEPGLRAETRTVASGDGVQIVYDVRGGGDLAVVFVHCWACNRLFWSAQADVFSSRYHVVTVDLAGHGESGKDRGRWSILGLAGDVVAVVDELGLRRVVLVGHSMGGVVSLEAARLLPGRVLGVVLVDTLHDVSKRRSVELARADADRLRADFAGYFADLSPLFSKTSDPSVRRWIERQAQAAYPAAAIGLKLDTPNLEPTALFERARVPIRAINAKPPLSEFTAIAENRRHGDYEAVLVDDAGHFLPLERPQAFNAALQRWIASLASSPGRWRGRRGPAATAR